MLCEICHKGEAKGVLHRKGDDGETEDVYVCEKCLAEAGKPSKTDAAGSAGSGNGAHQEDGDEPPGFIRNFLDAAVGLIEGVAHSGIPGERKCSVCGATWESIKSSGKVGCPECWTQFGGRIGAEYHRSDYGRKHLGKIPEKKPDGSPSREFLEKELKEAVAKQHYRKAAQLRKRLDAMDGGK